MYIYMMWYSCIIFIKKSAQYKERWYNTNVNDRDCYFFRNSEFHATCATIFSQKWRIIKIFVAFNLMTFFLAEAFKFKFWISFSNISSSKYLFLQIYGNSLGRIIFLHRSIFEKLIRLSKSGIWHKIFSFYAPIKGLKNFLFLSYISKLYF